ncbi:hypothetical protein MKD02_22375 [[Clostridium] innocuum]|nr:hypothetical protein [Massiliimalia sp.]MCR0372154.1 hypothetical protein [[Clostridium] innocuum]
MTALPGAACYVPIVRGRGKYDEPSKQNCSSRTGRYPAATAALIFRYGCFLTIE